MRITTNLTTRQLGQLFNLIMNCDTKGEMFDYLIHIGLNSIHARAMAATFEKPANVQYSRLPIYYLSPSTTTGMKQDQHGAFYKAS